MGVIFDVRKFNGKGSFNGGLDKNEIERIADLVSDALEGDDDLSFKLNKNSLVVKNEASRFSGDPTFKMLKIKGSFKGVDPDDERTWKSAEINQFRYEGKDGVVKVKDIGDKGSLGSLYDWENLDRLDEFVFRGDDIIYGAKPRGASTYLLGYDGDDTFFLYGGESVEGGKGKDKSIVTKNAVKYYKKSKRNFQAIEILDANSKEGDVVEVIGSESDFPQARVFRGVNPTVYYGENRSYLDIDFTKKPVFADFVTD